MISCIVEIVHWNLSDAPSFHRKCFSIW